MATPEIEKWVKEWLQTASPLDRQQVTFCTVMHDTKQNERNVDTRESKNGFEARSNSVPKSYVAKAMFAIIMHVIPGSQSSNQVQPFLFKMQALRETSRLSNLNTPGARRLLAELLPSIQSHSAVDVASTPFVSGLERTTAELSPESATKDSMHQLSPEPAAKDTVDQLSPEPAVKDSVDQLSPELFIKESLEHPSPAVTAKDPADQLSPESAAKGHPEQLCPEPAAKDGADQPAQETPLKVQRCPLA